MIGFSLLKMILLKALFGLMLAPSMEGACWSIQSNAMGLVLVVWVYFEVKTGRQN